MIVWLLAAWLAFVEILAAVERFLAL